MLTVCDGRQNATFGNVVELILSIAALTKGLFTVVAASLLGSVLSNLLLVLGALLLCAHMLVNVVIVVPIPICLPVACSFSSSSTLLPVFACLPVRPSIGVTVCHMEEVMFRSY